MDHQILRPTITLSASPDYSANDVVGGIITLTSVAARDADEVVLRSVVLKDAGGQAPALTLLFFRATPSGGTYTEALTSNGASANAVLVDVTTATLADPVKINANFDDVAARIAELIADDLDVRQAINALIDDLQTARVVG